jgi:hypothetical protein
MINLLSPCWRSILLTTTWHVWYTDECVVTLLALAEYTILLPGRCPHINFHVCVLHLKNIHTIVSSLQNLLGIPSSSATLLCNNELSVSWWLQEQELLRQQQRQCQCLVRMRKGLSQQQEHVNGMNTNQRSNKMKYGRPIGRGMQRGAHVYQRSNEVKYGRPIGRGMQRDTHVCQRSDEMKYGRPIGWGMQMGAHVCQRSDMQRVARIMTWTWSTRKRIHVTTVTVGISALIQDTS